MPESATTLATDEWEVTAMGQAAGRTLLRNLLNDKFQGDDEANNKDAESLSTILGGLPLAISIAAGFMRETRSTFTEALEFYRTWENRSILRNIWEANISGLSENAKFLIEVLSFLDSDSIPESLFKLSSDTPSRAETLSDLKTYLLSVKGLLEFSLIHRYQGNLSLHRLVQEATLDQMDEHARQKIFETAVEYVWKAFPRQPEEGLLMSSQWKDCNVYLSHVEALERRFNEFSFPVVNSLRFAEVLYFCSWCGTSNLSSRVS